MGLAGAEAGLAGIAPLGDCGALGAAGPVATGGVDTGGAPLPGNAGLVGSFRSAVLSLEGPVGAFPGMITAVVDDSPEGGGLGSVTAGALLVDRINPLGGKTGLGGAGGI